MSKQAPGDLKPVSQGEVWDAELSPVRGHEQAGRRPCVVVSTDRLGEGPSGLAIVVPLTSKGARTPLDVAIDPPEGGLDLSSHALPAQVRSISRERLVRHRGRIRRETLEEVVAHVRLLIRTG